MPHSRYGFYYEVLGRRRHHFLADWNLFAVDIVVGIRFGLWCHSYGFSRMKPVRGRDCDQQRYEGGHAADDTCELQQTTAAQNLVHGASPENGWSLRSDFKFHTSVVVKSALFSFHAEGRPSRPTMHVRKGRANLPLAKSLSAALIQKSVWFSSDHHHKCTYRNTTLQFFPGAVVFYRAWWFRRWLTR